MGGLRAQVHTTHHCVQIMLCQTRQCLLFIFLFAIIFLWSKYGPPRGIISIARVRSGQGVTVKTNNNESNYIDPCSHPFKHCCLGQCRVEQGRLQLKEDVPLLKNRPFVNLSFALGYFAKHIQKNQSKPCNFLFFGDSLSSDHAMGATCHLLSAGYTLKSCNNAFGGPQYGSDAKIECEANFYPALPHHVLENDLATSCQRVTIGYVPGAVGNSSYFAQTLKSAKEVHEAGGLIIFNWGVHCNVRNVSCISGVLSSSILPMLKGENSNDFRQWNFLFRETEPQHFEAPGGLFISPNPNPQSCSGRKVDNWRNEEAHMFLSAHNLTQQIPTIAIFDALAPLTQLHRPPDCTHYCYSPSRLDITWDGLMEALPKLVRS